MVGQVPGFEIAGYDRRLLEGNSSRRQEIVEWVRSHGLANTAANRQRAALATRKVKDEPHHRELEAGWRARAKEMGIDRNPPRPEAGRRRAAKEAGRHPTMLDPSMTWDDVTRMVRDWNGQFCLKGIMTVEDALRAAEIGCTGIVLSNHGGRQLDGSRAPFDQLAEVVDAVGDRLDVMMDSGIQRGTHVLKALSLAARAVGIGRGYLYPLAAISRPGEPAVSGKEAEDVHVGDGIAVDAFADKPAEAMQDVRAAVELRAVGPAPRAAVGLLTGRDP